ncbi:MAG: hypothetical protein WC471_03715 [Candidatus Woesearchaeota archaeon]
MKTLLAVSRGIWHKARDLLVRKASHKQQESACSLGYVPRL